MKSWEEKDELFQGRKKNKGMKRKGIEKHPETAKGSLVEHDKVLEEQKHLLTGLSKLSG